MKDADGNEIQVQFAPGAFDHFEGTQEELDAFQKEVMDLLQNLTPEELAERSVAVDDDYIANMIEEDPEGAQALLRALSGDSASGRNLQ